MKVEKSQMLLMTAIFLILYGCFFNAVKAISLSFSFTLFLSCILLCLSFLLQHKKTIILNVSLILFVFFCIISLVYTKSMEDSIRMTLIYSLFLFISLFLKYDKAIWLKFKKMLFVFCSIDLLITVLTFISKQWYLDYVLPLIFQESQPHMYNLVVYANSFPGVFASTGLNAFFLSVGYYLVLTDILVGNTKKKNYIFLSLFALGIILTLKRTSLIINLVITVLLLLHKFYARENNTFRKKNIIHLFVIIIMMLVFIFVFQQYIFSLLSRITDADNWLNGRKELYVFALNKIKENPFLGNGINSYAHLLQLQTNELLSTHNEFLQLTYELGFIQTFIIFGFMIYGVSKTFGFIKKIPKTDIINHQFLMVSLAVQIYFILYCMTGNPFHDMNIYCLYMIFVTFTIYFNRRNNYDAENN